MKNAYVELLEKAKSSKKEIHNFLNYLQKLQPKDLDQTTHAFHDEVFEQIDCLECANCCRGTGPLLKSKDVERLSKSLNVKPGVFTEKYLRVDEDNDFVFKKMPCPFLNDDNYCSQYENRPNACREFPHTQQRNILQKLNITYHNAIICPGVYLVVGELMKVYKSKKA